MSLEEEEPSQLDLLKRHKFYSCTVFTAVILMTLAAFSLLIFYPLLSHWGPRFGVVSTLTKLNKLNLEKGNLLNVNITLFTNFTNPNKKAAVDFKHIVVELYFGQTIIATKNVEPAFSVAKGGTGSVEVDMLASKVQLFELEIQRLKNEMLKDKILFEVKGRFLCQSKLWRHHLRYSYHMHGQCTLTFKKPPLGVLVSTKCKTKKFKSFF
ncbi:hypothetical protein F8388_014944 [Cannabis sativa]|uniref:Late embryogenesis abundant protein LEA-2 subgroup domain-containing protein n=1 Tax=Cannabis sativa TaxID=3483 RepID=A0A7J6F6E4_CANSA|nr:hypothetical protein F8388_014944 [Cannabis sativa]KAF4404934.1 hypothetical protein G4B88_006320 [Cannabis sativa]